ncbi:MAG: hypothetical protein JO113_08925 [Candidatus Eremiobacteraeota bacterium]|nr:hypothetical protein [Candidatus Eremiobacteraeota bacterium]
MSSSEWGQLVLDVLGGVGALLIGTGVLVAALALAKTLARVRVTLDSVDRQLENIGPPVTSTLAHVDEVTRSLDQTAGTLSRTADLAKSAVVPAIVNLGATLSGVTAGLRRLVTGKDRKAREQ